MRSKTNVVTAILLLTGIVIVINVLAEEYFVRLDFTADKRYTLGQATRNILQELEEPVTVTAYFSEDLPPDIARTRQDFRDLLIEYSNASDDMVVYEFINPNENEEVEQQAMQNGISPVLVNVREKDQVSQKRAYLGAIIQMGERQEIIPFIQPGAAMEYALSTSIKKLAVVDKPSVAVLQGHGEPSIFELQQVNNELSVLYSLENLTLTDTATIPDRFKTIAIIAPTDSFPESHLVQLDTFLARGGNLFIAFNRVEGNLQNAFGQEVTTGLEGWLEEKGLQVPASFVVDAACGAVTVQQQQGFFTFNSNVSFPYLPIISQFAEHPITEGLEAVIMPFSSPISYAGNDTTGKLKFTPLATTSELSGTVPAPAYFDISKEWTESDFTQAHLTVGAVLEGNIAGSTLSRMVVIADGNFATQGSGQGQSDNVSLLVNSVDWLSDDTGLIELRTKGVTSRPLEQLEEGTKTTLKYLNFLLPVLLVVGYGILRFQMKKNLRVKRMEESYV